MRLQGHSTTCHHSLGRCKGQIKVPSWSSTRQLVYWDALRHVAVHDCSKSQTVLEAVRKICDTDILQSATRTSTRVEKKDIVEVCSLRPPPAATPISHWCTDPQHSTPLKHIPHRTWSCAEPTGAAALLGCCCLSASAWDDYNNRKQLS